jgi:hypothetical protein
MPIPTLRKRELRGPAGPLPDHGGPRATDSQDYGWLARPSADTRPHGQPAPDEMSAAESDESLVADPRASLSPSQIVDQRVLALLGSGNPGSYIQASGKPGGVRRQTGE